MRENLTNGHTYMRFEAGESGLNVFTEVDVGYMEHLGCGGYMSTSFQVLPDDRKVAEVVLKQVGNHSNEFKVVWVRGSMYYVVSGTDPIFSVESKDSVFYTTVADQFSLFITRGYVPVARS